MGSAAQAEASRINGAKSKGPVTQEGKERSSLNAITHGLTAERLVLIDQEDQEQFLLYRGAFLADLAPQGALEEELVERIVISNWRLRRAARLETDMMNYDLGQAQNERDNDPRYSGAPKPTGPLASWRVGKKFQYTMSGPCSCYDSLGRYERRIERGLFQAIKELRGLRKDRCHASPSPRGGACPEAHEVPEAQDGPAGANMLPLEDSRKHGTEPAAPAAQTAPVAQTAPAEQPAHAGPAAPAEEPAPVYSSFGYKVSPGIIRDIEKMERSPLDWEREMAVQARKEMGLPPKPNRS